MKTMPILVALLAVLSAVAGCQTKAPSDAELNPYQKAAKNYDKTSWIVMRNEPKPDNSGTLLLLREPRTSTMQQIPLRIPASHRDYSKISNLKAGQEILLSLSYEDLAPGSDEYTKYLSIQVQ